MKYTVANTIDRPIDEVFRKLNDPDGAVHWVEGLQRIEHLEGTPGEVGAKSNFHTLYKKKEMVIHETILEVNPPRQIKYGYTSSMGYNEVELVLEELSDGSVKQVSHNYFELKGLMKIMGALMKGAFKKQSLKYMNAFKEYVEKGSGDAS